MATATKLDPALSQNTIVREHDIVRTIGELHVEGKPVPAGARGVIVHVHKANTAYEVEFENPACVLTLRAGCFAAL